METKTNRRGFLKLGAVTSSAALLASPAQALTAACGLTPPQTPGPFYPGEGQFTVDNDLTRLPGHATRAAGQVVYVRGQVVNQHCDPVKDANVEIWQACQSGRYNNAKDTNPAPVDPNFRYWGETTTNAAGEYMFKTVIPGAYPADKDWDRPPHIHFKVARLGHKDLVTQMYFKGNALNDKDLILQDIPKAQQASVIVEFLPAPADLEPGSMIGTFDITLRTIR